MKKRPKEETNFAEIEGIPGFFLITGEDMGGMTLVSRWVRTDRIKRITLSEWKEKHLPNGKEAEE
jgi:hypothetical protein